MADTVGFVVPTVFDVLVVILGQGSALAFGAGRLRSVKVREASDHRAVRDQTVGQDAFCIRIPLKAGQKDPNRNGFPAVWCGEPVPEVLRPQLARRIRQRWIEDEAKRMEEITLPASILAHDHRTRRQVSLKLVEIPEMLDLNA